MVWNSYLQNGKGTNGNVVYTMGFLLCTSSSLFSNIFMKHLEVSKIIPIFAAETVKYNKELCQKYLDSSASLSFSIAKSMSLCISTWRVMVAWLSSCGMERNLRCLKKRELRRMIIRKSKRLLTKTLISSLNDGMIISIDN